ncbi:MAG TPA: alpha/beta fold hydrolase [Candidatus Anoxymicrobiaceae bacterium]
MPAFMPTPQTVEIETADGVTLRCRRYRRPGARAVVCGHGQASTGYEFDLPLSGFNLAEKLYRLGYEVWIMNFRGAGHPPWQSDADGWRNSGDQQGTLDLPAVIDRVIEETGMPPFYIGHSFGGMSLYIYLEGCVPDPDDPTRVIRDPEVALERNKKIAAGLTAGSPITMAEEESDWMEKLRRHPWAQAVMKRVARFLIKRARRKPVIPIGRISVWFGFRHPRLTRIIMSSALLSMYLKPKNMGPEACGLFGTWAGGDVTCLHLAQTIQTVMTGELTSIDPEGNRFLSYAEGMGNITAPLAAAAGTKDFMRPIDIEKGVLGSASSERTLFLPINGCGHIDMLYYLPLTEITSWMEWAAKNA